MTAELMAERGITDVESGYAAAKESLNLILDPARELLSKVSLPVTPYLLVFQGFITRAQSLHLPAVEAAKAQNPHAAFTLLRAHAENAAAILYANKKNGAVEKFAGDGDYGIPVGRITTFAENHADGFKAVYNTLSSFAHPAPQGLMSPTTISDKGEFVWQSTPRFRRPEDELLAYYWTVELAEATGLYLREFVITHMSALAGGTTDVAGTGKGGT